MCVILDVYATLDARLASGELIHPLVDQAPTPQISGFL